MALKKIKTVFVIFLFLFLAGLSYSLTTLTVTEGDLVKLEPSVLDPDQDELFIRYSPPLNESGEWQTTLDDAGTYHTKITASDGISQTEEEIVIEVKNKNQPPEIEEKKLIVEETETIDLKTLISDPDQDPLKLIFQPPFQADGTWQTTYEDAGTYQTEILASDLEFKTIKTVEIEVKNKNRPPEILSLFSEDEIIPLVENTTFSFSVSAQDPDQDPLVYSWQLDSQAVSSQPSFTHHFNFESAGEHSLTLFISDQKSETKKTWILNIENLNRPPEIDHPDILVDEGEKIILQLPETDLDHDPLTYTFTPPLQADGTWQTTYEDAGTYTSLITASDGQLTAQKELQLTITDVDRPPLINLDKKITIDEEEKLQLNLEDFVSDPDGDPLIFNLENLPEGADFQSPRLQWLPGYDFVQRKPNLFTNLLNRLRIEKYLFPPHKKISLLLNACGKKLCANHTLLLQVNNVNRPPLLEELEPLTITETETLLLQPEATDPDHDIIKYHFEKPFNQNGVWPTSYDSQSEFLTSVTASDGELTDTKTVKIIVQNKNRPPTLDIEKDYYKLNENQPLSFLLSASDPENDNLTLSAESLPPGASFQDQLFSWTPDYSSVTERKPTFLNNFYARFPSLNRRFSQEYHQYLINFAASDGEFTTLHPVLITVKNVNRPPQVTDYSPAKEILAQINEPLQFRAFINDPDRENLTYTWSFGLWARELKTSSLTLERTFTEPGSKTVKITASDGTYSAQQEWKVKVSPPPLIPKPAPTALTPSPSAPSTPPEPSPLPSPLPSPPPSPPPKFNVYVVEYAEESPSSPAASSSSSGTVTYFVEG